ncbi:MAG: erythromycin esterase family protein [Gammaproteobacteria bacterium]|nr:erythromycin esterase family protein [Gammaproteobacteria bacterium]
MDTRALEKLVRLLNESIYTLSPGPDKYTSLVNNIGDAQFVLLGEATHGTHEFYQARIEITKRLIAEKGFMAVAIEGDWPDVYEIHRYLNGKGQHAKESLHSFTRFPTWMWRNETMIPFLEWLRHYNDKRNVSQQKIGFYGLDVYSLYASIQVVIEYLERVDPAAAENAKQRYACFDHVKQDPQSYGYQATLEKSKSCVKAVTQQWLELQSHVLEYIKKDEFQFEEAYFNALQNALIVKNAEHYYRSLFEGAAKSWNVRDQHMAETFNVLINHLEDQLKQPAKIVVWAHNSHLGDARATEMSAEGEINLGQLIREQYPRDTFSLGFSTYEGIVTAAAAWGDPPAFKQINPGLPGSYEDLFHALNQKEFFLLLRGNKTLEHYLKIGRLQRAIGVVYKPETEQTSHYFFTKLPLQFDAMIHIDKTSALPLL